jgi:outer membrane PBP1 activator LpoA protein
MKPRRLTLSAALVLAALAGCAAGLPSYSSSSSQSTGAAGDAQKALAHSDYTGAARAFEQSAAQAAPPQSYEYHLRAAEAATDGNDYAYAGSVLDALPVGVLNPEQQLRWRLLRARAALARNDAAGALRWMPDNAGTSPLAERVLLLRGRALFRQGDAVAGTQALVQRERHLSAPALVAENHDAIWSELSAASLDAATLSRAGNADPVSRGWIELANLARRNASLEMFEGWRQRYPNHPAQDRLASLLMPAQAPAAAAPAAPAALPGTPAAPAQAFNSLPARPGFYALLLPQGGALAGLSDSIRSGFAAAEARAGDNTDVKVYDTGGNPAGTQTVYGQAVGEGAGLIVGPLLKGDVTALSQGGSLRLPVLALNYLDPGHTVPAGFYQFGLAPEDEARAAAEDAVARGLHRAVALVPQNERGARVLAAFSQRLGELGGSVVGSGHYAGEPKDWAEPVSSLLHYRAVSDRKKLAELRASAAPGIDPQRRNDFDFVFIDGGASQARILWPLFRYYHAERMPIYDTAAVNEGHGDPDLAGIRFCDAPWLLDSSGTWNALRDAADNNGRPIDQARLYVMGDDAYQLSQRLARNSLHPQDELPGATGTLRVGEDGAIHRGLVCARTTEGEPQLLEPPGATP